MDHSEPALPSDSPPDRGKSEHPVISRSEGVITVTHEVMEPLTSTELEQARLEAQESFRLWEPPSQLDLIRTIEESSIVQAARAAQQFALSFRSTIEYAQEAARQVIESSRVVQAARAIDSIRPTLLAASEATRRTLEDSSIIQAARAMHQFEQGIGHRIIALQDAARWAVEDSGIMRAAQAMRDFDTELRLGHLQILERLKPTAELLAEELKSIKTYASWATAQSSIGFSAFSSEIQATSSTAVALRPHLEDSPFEWVLTDWGLLVALRRDQLITHPSLEAIVVRVAQSPKLHEMVIARLEPYGDHVRQAFHEGLASFLDFRYLSALPTLLAHLEGVIALVACELGSAIPHPRKGLTDLKLNRGGDGSAAEGLINTLHWDGFLTEQEHFFLLRHVYGGFGNPIRHGRAFGDSYTAFGCAKVILAYHLVLSIG